jgi:hypothetical protein
MHAQLLVEAAMANDVVRCRKLIERGEEMNEALHYAVGRGRLEIVNLLIESGIVLEFVILGRVVGVFSTPDRVRYRARVMGRVRVRVRSSPVSCSGFNGILHSRMPSVPTPSRFISSEHACEPMACLSGVRSRTGRWEFGPDTEGADLHTGIKHG